VGFNLHPVRALAPPAAATFPATVRGSAGREPWSAPIRTIAVITAARVARAATSMPARSRNRPKRPTGPREAGSARAASNRLASACTSAITRSRSSGGGVSGAAASLSRWQASVSLATSARHDSQVCRCAAKRSASSVALVVDAGLMNSQARSEFCACCGMGRLGGERSAHRRVSAKALARIAVPAVTQAT